MLLEAGGGVGGTWFWNRYPGARFDSESYTYGYLFSKELFDEWEWQEHFAGQPETERYLNHVVDRFDLRRHIRFDAPVTSAVWDETSATWVVTAGDGSEIRARFLDRRDRCALGAVPPRRAGTRGLPRRCSTTPAAGRRNRSTSPASASRSSARRRAACRSSRRSSTTSSTITVYQRTANWCTPLNNRPITPEEQAELRAGFEALRETLNTSLSGFAHPVNERAAFDDSEAERRAFFEKLWNSPGFMKLTSNYYDLLFNEAANDEWCAFIAEKIRGIVRDPETAERLIPKDHRFGGKRPPFVNGYFEAFNDPKVSLVDLRETPIVRVTETGIETTDGVRDFDIIVWATGFDFGTGALSRMGIRGRDGLALTEHWADGPSTFLGLQTRGFPNFFFPGGPHAAAGNNPRYNGDLVDIVTDTLVYATEHGYDVIEVTAEAEERWTRMVDKGAAVTTFGTIGQYVGSNIPGKPRRYLLNTGGRLKLFEISADVVADDYRAYEMSKASEPAGDPA